METKRSFGCIPGLPDHRDFRASMIPGALATVQPPMVDLLSQLPPVYDQDGIGSCSSNACAGLFRFNIKKQQLADFDPSRLWLYYEARKLRGWQDSDSGSVIADNIALAINPGLPPELDWPYIPSKFRDAPPQKSYDDAKAHEATVYARIEGLDEMRGCLAAGFPFEFGITLYEGFESPQTWQTGEVPEPSGAVIGGHAMLCVGYDDSTRRFRIRNSWGSGWGQSGNGTISYDYMLNLGFDLWTIRQVTGPIEPPTPPDPDFVNFDGVVIKGKSGKVTVRSNSPLIKNIAGRQVRATFAEGSFNGRVKSIEADWIVIKPTTFSPTWNLKGEQIHVETIA
jgi:hypothetical protein